MKLPNNNFFNIIGSIVLNTIKDFKNIPNKMYDSSLFDILKISSVKKSFKMLLGITIVIYANENGKRLLAIIGDAVKTVYEVLTSFM